jgi:hypothetical protein
MTSVSMEAEINRAALLGERLEHLIYDKSKEGKLVAIGKNDHLLLGFWSLIFEYGKGIGCLLHHKFYAPAFALFRPTVEALVRAGIVLVGTPDEVEKIRQDRFNVSYEKDGARLDKALGTGTLLEQFLKETRSLLHSLTHSGTAQLGMRFDGDSIGANVSEAQTIMLLNASSNAAFLITILIAMHYNMEDVARTANDAFLEYGEANLAVIADVAP